MKNENSYLSEVFRIVAGALRLDVNKVRNYSAFLAEKLEAAGDASSANRLRKLLAENDHQLHPANSAIKAIPVDGETRLPLLERIEYLADEPALIIQQAQNDLLEEFISVGKSRALLEQQDVSTALALLVYGPPGCGKTRLARHLARELGLPLYLARLDGLISSFLGSTAKNIRAIFEFAASTPCVLLLDEFDAIAKLRDDSQELGELKRVVNSFLQNLDALGLETVVVAATNHPQLLDSAVWRRFSYRLELPLPNVEDRKQIWTLFLGNFFTPEEIKVLCDLSEGLSGGDIKEVSLHLRRRTIALQTKASLHDAFTSLLRIAIGSAGDNDLIRDLRGASLEECGKILRNRNSALYSLSRLSSLLGISRATIHRWIKKGG